MYQKILVPLDGSSRAEAILPHAKDLARSLRAEVILLYVDESADLMLERDEVVDVNRFLENRRRQLKAKEDYFQAIADEWSAGDIAVRWRIAHGSVVRGIIDCAAKEAVDLVAMASHGMAGVESTYYGSVAAGVLNRIDRPLLLIRSQFTK
jgi:nucleotide-binding universal stress UspA family protein